MKCPHWLPRALRPLHWLRRRIVVEKFRRGHLTCPERVVRAACESIIDAVEMWHMRPAFEAMEAQAREAEDLACRIQALLHEVESAQKESENEGGEKR